MRRLRSTMFMALDGVVARPETWSLDYWNDEIAGVIGAGMESTDALLLGRVTYEEFAASWSTRTVEDDPGAEYMNGVRKYVVSRTLDRADWTNSSVLEGDLREEVGRLKAASGGDIAVSGSPSVVRQLMRAGLLDELTLLVYPVVVGAGIRLFEEEDARIYVRLESATGLSGGVVQLVYGPAEGR